MVNYCLSRANIGSHNVRLLFISKSVKHLHKYELFARKFQSQNKMLGHQNGKQNKESANQVVNLVNGN